MNNYSEKFQTNGQTNEGYSVRPSSLRGSNKSASNQNLIPKIQKEKKIGTSAFQSHIFQVRKFLLMITIQQVQIKNSYLEHIKYFRALDQLISSVIKQIIVCLCTTCGAFFDRFLKINFFEKKVIFPLFPEKI